MLETLLDASRTAVETADEALRILNQTEEAGPFVDRIRALNEAMASQRSQIVSAQLSVAAVIAQGRKIVSGADDDASK